MRWKIDGLPNAGSAGLTIVSQDTGKPVLERQGLSAPGEGSAVIEGGGSYYILVSSYETAWTLSIEPVRAPSNS